MVQTPTIADPSSRSWPHALDALAPRGGPFPDQDKRIQLLEHADRLLRTDDGLETLWSTAPSFDARGLFHATVWEDPARLQVPLVSGTLVAPGLTPIVEILSELRMLAIATHRAEKPAVSPEEAAQFLDEVLARNLKYLTGSGGDTEASRVEGGEQREVLEGLFELIATHRGIGTILAEVVFEIDQLLVQEPVSTWRVRRTIERAHRLATEHDTQSTAAERLAKLHAAIHAPTPLSAKHTAMVDYRSALQNADANTLEREAQLFADSLNHSGLVAPHHAVFVRHALENASDLVPVALAADETGVLEWESNRELLTTVLERCLYPTTAQCAYGFGRALNRSIFSRAEVQVGIERLLDLEIREDVATVLLARRAKDDDVTAGAVLLAGTLAMLGQPLGIGQGNNPTCQSARGLSLWAQHDPAHLLEALVAAARDGGLEVRFRGELLCSDAMISGLAPELDLDLDPVSLVLVPHLDRLYGELMRRCCLSLEDAHKWVNPALYGRWVQNEFASAFADLAQTTVVNYQNYVRCFFATHHPDYNGERRLMYPNPVGILITNHFARYLGPHAVSIQRVEPDETNAMRVYFYNPNNEGRQNWGQGIEPTVTGHGEQPGESSLPFEQFASRIYAFHYNPNEEGDRATVDAAAVQRVVELARESWGERFVWL